MPSFHTGKWLAMSCVWNLHIQYRRNIKLYAFDHLTFGCRFTMPVSMRRAKLLIVQPARDAMRPCQPQSCSMAPLDNICVAIQRNITADKAEVESQKQAAKVLSSVTSGILICKKRDRLLTYSNSEGHMSHSLDDVRWDNNDLAKDKEGLHLARQ